LLCLVRCSLTPSLTLPKKARQGGRASIFGTRGDDDVREEPDPVQDGRVCDRGGQGASGLLEVLAQSGQPLLGYHGLDQCVPLPRDELLVELPGDHFPPPHGCAPPCKSAAWLSAPACGTALARVCLRACVYRCAWWRHGTHEFKYACIVLGYVHVCVHTASIGSPQVYISSHISRPHPNPSTQPWTPNPRAQP